MAEEVDWTELNGIDRLIGGYPSGEPKKGSCGDHYGVDNDLPLHGHQPYVPGKPDSVT